MEEGVRILGAVPTKERIVAERFFDDSGGMQLVIHSPFGSRINRAWGMSLRKEICRAFDFELQAAATEDGINLSLGPSQSFPLEDVFKYIRPDKVEKVLTQAILQAPIFGVRWRWDASRALAVLRFSSGKKVPAPLQRMRSEDLLAAVFPEQVACQDNAMPGDIEVPDHPIVFETMRDCTTEAMDMEGLKALLESIRAGDVEVYARDTTQPSVFSHQILNAMPYAFLDDAPLEERRSRAVALRRALPGGQPRPGQARRHGAIRAAAADAWPLVRDADELHDALLTLGLLPESELARGVVPPGVETAREWFAALVADGRAVTATYADGRSRVGRRRIGPDRAGRVPGRPVRADAAGQARPGVRAHGGRRLFEIVRGWVESIGPFTSIGPGRHDRDAEELGRHRAGPHGGERRHHPRPLYAGRRGRGGLRPAHSRQDSPRERSRGCARPSSRCRRPSTGASCSAGNTPRASDGATPRCWTSSSSCRASSPRPARGSRRSCRCGSPTTIRPRWTSPASRATSPGGASTAGP